LLRSGQVFSVAFNDQVGKISGVAFIKELGGRRQAGLRQAEARMKINRFVPG